MSCDHSHIPLIVQEIREIENIRKRKIKSRKIDKRKRKRKIKSRKIDKRKRKRKSNPRCQNWTLFLFFVFILFSIFVSFSFHLYLGIGFSIIS